MIFRYFSYIIWKIRFNPIELIYAKSMSEMKIIEFMESQSEYTNLSLHSLVRSFSLSIAYFREHKFTQTDTGTDTFTIWHGRATKYEQSNEKRMMVAYIVCNWIRWESIRSLFFISDGTMNELLKFTVATAASCFYPSISMHFTSCVKSILSFILYLSHVFQ